MSEKKQHQISMAASAIAMRGVQIFLNAGRAAAERRASPPRSRRAKTVIPGNKLQKTVMESLLKTTKFTKNELEALFTMYRKLVTSAQISAAPSVIGQPAAKVDAYVSVNRNDESRLSEQMLLFIGNSSSTINNAIISKPSISKQRQLQMAPIRQGIDQNTFRDVMHNTFDLVTEDVVLDRVWLTWERGAFGGEGALKFEAWARGLSVLLRGSDEERRAHCFAVYDLNGDGYITRDEMFILLKNSLLKQPGDEDPDEGVRDLVELVLRKMDVDKDGKLSMDDYRQAVQQEPLLLEAFGQCLPSRRHAATFLKTLSTKI